MIVRRSEPKTRIKFKNPPIQELVIGIYHLPIVELRSQHIGKYWIKIQDKYPQCEQQPPIELIEQGLPGEVFPLPRFWFFKDESSTLVQVQRNAFIFNWRRGDKNTYHKFEQVRDSFEYELEIYQDFLQSELSAKIDVVRKCELTYTNLITPNELWSTPEDLGKVLPALAGLPEIKGAEFHGTNSVFGFRVNPTLLVDLVVRVGKKSDSGDFAMILELKAHGVPDDLAITSTRDWFEKAHDAIYTMFLSITDKALQKVWLPR